LPIEEPSGDKTRQATLGFGDGMPHDVVGWVVDDGQPVHWSKKIMTENIIR
jgi:hypothetical protein